MYVFRILTHSRNVWGLNSKSVFSPEIFPTQPLPVLFQPTHPQQRIQISMSLGIKQLKEDLEIATLCGFDIRL